MVRTIARLPPATVQALKVAAAIGNRFDLDVLATLSACSPEEAYGRLDHAFAAGLVDPVGDGFRFVHDKVHEAAYSMIEEAERSAFHLRIGRLLADRLDLSEARGLFDVVGHLNRAGDLVADAADRVALARMNLDAAARARTRALSTRRWATSRRASFACLRTPGARTARCRLSWEARRGLMEALTGRHDDALATLSDCLAHAESRLERTELLRKQITVQCLRNDLPAARAAGLEALRLFGIDLPEALTTPCSRRNSRRPWRSSTTARSTPCPSCRASRTRAPRDARRAPGDRPSLLLPLRERLRARHGQAVRGFAPVRSVEAHPVRLRGVRVPAVRARGRRARLQARPRGRAARRAPQRSGNDADAERRLGAFIQHWQEGYAAARDSLLTGVHAGLETGQYLWAFYCAANAITSSILRGRRIDEILDEARSYKLLRKLDKFENVTWMIGSVAQIGHHLSVPTERPTTLAGEWVDIEPVRKGRAGWAIIRRSPLPTSTLSSSACSRARSRRRHAWRSG